MFKIWLYNYIEWVPLVRGSNWLASHDLPSLLTKQTHIIQGLSVINGICRTSPSFSHFATEPEMKRKKNYFKLSLLALLQNLKILH